MTVQVSEKDWNEFVAYKKQIAERQKRLAARSQVMRAERANPVGPRHDESNGQVPEERHGDPNPCATGPTPQTYAPAGGHWEAYGPGGKTERWIPEPEPAPVTPAPFTEIKFAPKEAQVAEPWLRRGSGIGARPVSRFAASPCGPAPMIWQPPVEEITASEVKTNPMIKFVPKKS